MSRRAAVIEALRVHTAEAERVAHAFAGLHRLHPTDLQALMAVMHAENRGDPLTPGRLGEELGLSSGATTAVIDRLERLGHLRRSREHEDRRRVILRYADPGYQLAASFFAPLGRRTAAVMDEFSDDDLDVVLRFLSGMTEAVRAHRREVESLEAEPG